MSSTGANQAPRAIARRVSSSPALQRVAMRAALKKADKPGEIVLYPDAPHAFFADYWKSYMKDAAEDGWKRMLAWFKKYGA